MEINEENTPEVISEVPMIDENVEIKIPKVRVTNAERSLSVSPIRKFTIRQSTDCPATRPQANYEIIQQSRSDSKHQELLSTVQLQRYDSTESPKDKALNNGLDPIGIELISSANLTSKAGSEYSNKSDEIHATIKISREMKNLQKSTNESKILSDYLNATSESPRSRSRKTKETPLADPDEEEENAKEIVSSESPITTFKDAADSDSTPVLPMEPPEKRRKSVSRARMRSRSTIRSRKKSVTRIASEEISVSSDKEEAPEDEDDDQLSEVSFVTNRSLDGRAVNPPPKVSFIYHK